MGAANRKPAAVEELPVAKAVSGVPTKPRAAGADKPTAHAMLVVGAPMRPPLPAKLSAALPAKQPYPSSPAGQAVLSSKRTMRKRLPAAAPAVSKAKFTKMAAKMKKQAARKAPRTDKKATASPVKATAAAQKGARRAAH